MTETQIWHRAYITIGLALGGAIVAQTYRLFDDTTKQAVIIVIAGLLVAASGVSLALQIRHGRKARRSS